MIKSLEELTDFLKICRKQGVTEIKFAGVSVNFGELPKKPRKDSADEGDMDFPSDGLTEEQLAFYSAPGMGDENIEGQKGS